MTLKQDRSNELFKRAEKVIPGGVNSPVRAFRAVEGAPVMIARGAGAEVWDADNNAYIDLVGSWGPLILGHAAEPIVEALREARIVRRLLRDDPQLFDRGTRGANIVEHGGQAPMGVGHRVIHSHGRLQGPNGISELLVSVECFTRECVRYGAGLGVFPGLEELGDGDFVSRGESHEECLCRVLVSAGGLCSGWLQRQRP